MSTYYLNADTGDNANAGSSASPWETLAYAYDNSSADDTLYCQTSTSTYDWVTDTIANRTITGQSATGVVFDGADTVVKWSISGTINLNYITFQNETKGAGTFSSPFSGADAHTFTVTGCIFEDIDNGTHINGSGIIYSNADASGGNQCTTTFNSCIFDDVLSTTGKTGYEQGIFNLINPPAASTLSLYNCVINQTESTGLPDNIFVATSNGNEWSMFFQNNIFYNSTGVTVKLCNSYGGANPKIPVLLDHNTYYTNYSMSDTDYDVTNTNNITTDPKFVDVGSSDFRLQQDSPCIDTGTVI